MQTTSGEVVVTFAVTPRARTLLERWQTDPVRPHVPRMVMRHTTRVLYELKPTVIEATCEASEHGSPYLTGAWRMWCCFQSGLSVTYGDGGFGARWLSVVAVVCGAGCRGGRCGWWPCGRGGPGCRVGEPAGGAGDEFRGAVVRFCLCVRAHRRPGEQVVHGVRAATLVIAVLRAVAEPYKVSCLRQAWRHNPAWRGYETVHGRSEREPRRITVRTRRREAAPAGRAGNR